MTTLFDLPRPVPTPPPAKPATPKPLVIGLDIAIGTSGIAGEGWTDHVHAKDRSLHERMQRQLDGITDYIKCADLVVIEGAAFAKARLQGMDQLSAMRWMVRHWCWRHDIQYAIVPPDQRIRYMTGTTQPKDPETGKRASGDVLKGIVRSAVAERYGIETEGRWRYDEADAYVMLALGMHRLGHRLADVPEAHAKALAGCQWPDLGAAA
jgi:hypothetical protein